MLSNNTCFAVCSCYSYLFQDIFSTELRWEKLQDSSLIVSQSHQSMMILNKARRPIHIILTESTLLLSHSFIINPFLDQNFSEGAHLYLVACLFSYVTANQFLTYLRNRRNSDFCSQEQAVCIWSCDDVETNQTWGSQMSGQIFSSSICWMLDYKIRDWRDMELIFSRVQCLSASILYSNFNSKVSLWNTESCPKRNTNVSLLHLKQSL